MIEDGVGGRARMSVWGVGLNALAGAAAVGLWQLPLAAASLRVPLFLLYGLLWIASIAVGVVQVADGAARLRAVVHLLCIVPGGGHVFGLVGHAGDLVGLAVRRGARVPEPPA